MQKLVILDFEKGEVHTYSINPSRLQEINSKGELITYEDIIETFGHNESNCQWMVINSDEYIINH